MVQAVDLRAGMTFVKDGKLIKVIESNHHKPGKGNTLMQLTSTPKMTWLTSWTWPPMSNTNYQWPASKAK